MIFIALITLATLLNIAALLLIWLAYVLWRDEGKLQADGLLFRSQFCQDLMKDGELLRDEYWVDDPQWRTRYCQPGYNWQCKGGLMSD